MRLRIRSKSPAFAASIIASVRSVVRRAKSAYASGAQQQGAACQRGACTRESRRPRRQTTATHVYQVLQEQGRCFEQHVEFRTRYLLCDTKLEQLAGDLPQPE
jgi:hypothetical protein